MQTFYKKIINWNIKLREINSSVAIIFLSAFMLGAAPFTLKSIDETYYNANTIEDFLRTETLILDSLNSSPNRTDLLWRLARNQFRIAKRTTDERQKLSLFENCLNTAKKGISIDKNSAENIYYMGLCLGNISLLKGILSSLSHREVLKSSMERAVEINPNVENAGPHRFLGVYFNVLPFFLGGDSDKAISHMKTAVKLAPDFAENYIYFGKVYFENGYYLKAKPALERFLKLAEAIKNDPELLKQIDEAHDLLREIKTYSQQD